MDEQSIRDRARLHQVYIDDKRILDSKEPRVTYYDPPERPRKVRKRRKKVHQGKVGLIIAGLIVGGIATKTIDSYIEKERIYDNRLEIEDEFQDKLSECDDYLDIAHYINSLDATNQRGIIYYLMDNVYDGKAEEKDLPVDKEDAEKIFSQLNYNDAPNLEIYARELGYYTVDDYFDKEDKFLTNMAKVRMTEKTANRYQMELNEIINQEDSFNADYPDNELGNPGMNK
ncbi:MAG: hypothetical protein IJH18_01750 [Bacilli bacterium]|nr:hypothetical protein [Bacilli bacterium]